MSKETTGIPKGTRDFTPDQMIRRNHIFDTITGVFMQHGFLPIETPAMENLSSLLGKYGEEGDKLLFKILNSGDFLRGLNPADLTELDPGPLSMRICERGLRYDLTVPFARFVVQHRSEITFPFRRYQIQPVWRADKPQKGRYREFYQCDVDVVGSDSLLNEAEMIQVADEVFTALGISVTIRINNRKILAGIAEVIGAADKMQEITVAIDKLEKIGMEQVMEELISRQVPAEAIDRLQPLLQISGTSREKLDQLESFLGASETGLKGLNEFREVLDFLSGESLTSLVEFDLTLARGLDYYTGAIIEVVANDMKMGSICGGGRYDNLTGVFGMEGVSGVGISFGADRIYDVMEHLNLFPDAAVHTTRVLFIHFSKEDVIYILPLLKEIRKAGIHAELYPDAARIKKQMTYADSRGIPFVALVGEEERKEKKITLKDMRSGEQKKMDLGSLIAELGK